jgi:DNA-binding transcriptional ArsR family regulator
MTTSRAASTPSGVLVPRGELGHGPPIIVYFFEGLKITSYGSDVPHKTRPVHEVKAKLFRVLGHPARVRILELLREDELSVGALQLALDLDSGGTSQHLAALRRIGLVESRRQGTSVYYRVDDEHVFDLLEAGRSIISRQLAEQQEILQDLESS